MERTPQYAHRKPGMFPSYGMATVKVSAWLLIVFLLLAALYFLILACMHHPTASLRTFCTIGFVTGAVCFAKAAKTERRDGRGMRIFMAFIALNLLVLAANVSGLLG